MKSNMKAMIFSLIALFLMNYTSYAQNITEEELVSLPDGTTADAFSLVYDSNTGKSAYVKYDAEANKYSVIYDGNESGKYEFISSYDIKFDSRGNYYVLASQITDPDNYVYTYILIVNGDSISSYNNAESYNGMITKNDEYKFTVRSSQEVDATSRIVTYSISGGLSESGEYAFVKPIYKGGMAEEGTGEDPYNNFFTDKDGNTGYIISDGIFASIMFGDNVMKTEYTDIDPSSFVYDNYGVLTYIAKIGGQFYVAPGNEFVVQGDKRYTSFDNVYGPIQFTPSNEPVYTGSQSVSDYTFYSFLVKGDERQDAYTDKDKKIKGQAFTGGVYNIVVDDKGNISYYGSIYEEEMTSKEGGFTKTSYVVNNVMSEFYYGLGDWKFNASGDGLVTYNPNKDYYTSALLYKKGNKITQVNKETFSSIMDYGFTNSGKIYYTAMKDGDYDKKIKPQYFIYIDNILIGKYETILFEGYGNNFSTIQFDGQDNYAYAVSTFDYYDEGGEFISPSAYVITNKGKQDPKVLSGNSLKDFNYIDFMFYSTNHRLFYFGGINDYPNNKYYSEIIIDGNNAGKVYSSVAYMNYDKTTNTAKFFGSRDNKVYRVTVSF